MNREVTNGVRADEFIQAVAWSKEPIIRAELQKTFEITTDPEILKITVVAKDASHADSYRKRLEEFIANLPADGTSPYGTGYKLLVTLGQEFGMAAKPAYVRYMEHASLRQRRSMCRVLAEMHGDWSVELLGPVLDDTRPAEGWDYQVIPGQNEPRRPIRLCDEAAETIARNFPKLSYKMAGEHKDLDRQIAQMRDQISRHDY